MKRVIFLSLALMCMGSGFGADPLNKVDPSGQTVRFWYQHTREREDALKKLIDRFNQTNPHKIKVVGEFAGRYDDIYNKMIAGMRTGDVAELIVAYQNQSATYFLAEGIVDLTPYVDSPKWGLSAKDQEDFFPGFLSQDLSGTVRLGFPPNRSMEVLYYNEDWLKELGVQTPPKTWDEFAKICCAAKDKPFSKRLNPKTSLGYELSVDTSRFAAMVFSRGGSLMKEDLSAYTLNTPEAKETLVFLKKLMDSKCASLVAEQYGDQADFGAGSLLFSIASSSGIPSFIQTVKQGAQFQWNMAALPTTKDKPVQNVYGASLSVTRTTPQKQLAAWLFIKWFAETEQQAEWAKASNYFPVRRSAVDALSAYLAENPIYEKAFSLLEYGKSEPPAPGYDVVRNMIEEAVVDVMNGAEAGSRLKHLEDEANVDLKEQRDL